MRGNSQAQLKNMNENEEGHQDVMRSHQKNKKKSTFSKETSTLMGSSSRDHQEHQLPSRPSGCGAETTPHTHCQGLGEAAKESAWTLLAICRIKGDGLFVFIILVWTLGWKNSPVIQVHKTHCLLTCYNFCGIVSMG